MFLAAAPFGQCGGQFFMTLLQQLAQDVIGIESDLPQTFTFSGTAYACFVNDLHETKPAEDAGYDPGWDLEITCRVAVFGSATAPDINDEVTWSARIYRVQSRNLSLDGNTYTYGLNRAQ